MNIFSKTVLLLSFFAIYVVANGTDVNAENQNGNTILHRASFDGDMEKIKSLIKKGVDVNCKGEGGDTPLIAAAGEGHIEVVKFLIANGADVNGKGEFGYTALLRAIDHRQYDVAKLLIENDADVGVEDQRDGTTCLHIAAIRGDMEFVKLLLAHDTNVNIKDNIGGTALHSVAFVGDKEVAELLITKGANVNDKGGFRGRTALHIATRNGHINMVKLLISNDANMNAIDENGWTPLRHASRGSYVEVMKILIAGGADINPMKGRDAWTPLSWAAEEGDYDLVKLLIAKGADVNGIGEFGTALNGAARNGHLKIAEFLISKGAKANIKSKFGQMPLHNAAMYGYLDIAKLLIANGADVNIKDDEGKTALDYAHKYKHKEIAELLRKHCGGNWNLQQSNETFQGDPSLVPWDPNSMPSWQSNDGLNEIYHGKQYERYRYVADLNFDGIMDLALSEPMYTFGQGGGQYTLYLGNADGSFMGLGTVGGRSMSLKRQKHGQGMLYTYWGCGGGCASITEHSISVSGIKKISSKELHVGDYDDSRQEDNDEFKRIFNDKYTLIRQYSKTNNGKVFWLTRFWIKSIDKLVSEIVVRAKAGDKEAFTVGVPHLDNDLPGDYEKRADKKAQKLIEMILRSDIENNYKQRLERISSSKARLNYHYLEKGCHFQIELKKIEEYGTWYISDIWFCR